MTRRTEDNRVELAGRLSAPPTVHELDAGNLLVVLRLAVRRPDGRRSDGLPVVVGPSPDPGVRRRPGQAGRRTVQRAARLPEGHTIRVSGWLQRHFWESGGRRLSRLQVVAEQLESAPDEAGEPAHR